MKIGKHTDKYLEAIDAVLTILKILLVLAGSVLMVGVIGVHEGTIEVSAGFIVMLLAALVFVQLKKFEFLAYRELLAKEEPTETVGESRGEHNEDTTPDK